MSTKHDMKQVTKVLHKVGSLWTNPHGEGPLQGHIGPRHVP